MRGALNPPPRDSSYVHKWYFRRVGQVILAIKFPLMPTPYWEATLDEMGKFGRLWRGKFPPYAQRRLIELYIQFWGENLVRSLPSSEKVQSKGITHYQRLWLRAFCTVWVRIATSTIDQHQMNESCGIGSALGREERSEPFTSLTPALLPRPKEGVIMGRCDDNQMVPIKAYIEQSFCKWHFRAPTIFVSGKKAICVSKLGQEVSSKSW